MFCLFGQEAGHDLGDTEETYALSGVPFLSKKYRVLRKQMGISRALCFCENVFKKYQVCAFVCLSWLSTTL